MALIEIQLPKSLAKALRLPQKSPRRQQLKVLRKLLKKARFTEFGQKYRFDEILLDRRHPGKKFQRSDMVRFQKRMARLQVNVPMQAFDVITLLRQARADAVEPADVGIVDGGAEKGGVAPVEKRFMPAGAAGDVLLKQALQEKRSGTGAGEDEKDFFLIFQN